jgi:hypothetical protein
LVFSHIACSTITRARSSNSQNRGSDVSSGSTCSYRHRHQNPPTQVYHHHTTLFLTFVDATATSYRPPSKKYSYDRHCYGFPIRVLSITGKLPLHCTMGTTWKTRSTNGKSQQLLFIKMDTSNDLHAGVSTVHLQLCHIVSTSSSLEFLIREVLIRGATESLQRQQYISFNYRTCTRTMGKFGFRIWNSFNSNGHSRLDSTTWSVKDHLQTCERPRRDKLISSLQSEDADVVVVDDHLKGIKGGKHTERARSLSSLGTRKMQYSVLPWRFCRYMNRKK